MPESQLVKFSEQKSQDYLNEQNSGRQIVSKKKKKINGHPLRSHLNGSHQ